MNVRSCPDWPELMEIDPDLQFKHYTANEAKLPAEAQMQLNGLNFDEAEVCADLDKYVYNAEHTHPRISEALRGTHWVELRDPSRPH
jgi:hypothetical protein